MAVHSNELNATNIGRRLIKSGDCFDASTIDFDIKLIFCADPNCMVKYRTRQIDIAVLSVEEAKIQKFMKSRSGKFFESCVDLRSEYLLK